MSNTNPNPMPFRERFQCGGGTGAPIKRTGVTMAQSLWLCCNCDAPVSVNAAGFCEPCHDVRAIKIASDRARYERERRAERGR